ncbi:MAG: M23 family metallopeptidase [Bacteroidota bacterium]
MEIYLCFSVSEKLNKGGLFRKILFALPVVLSIALTCYLFPVLLKTYPFPPKEECVVLELPFNGIWLAGHAGASYDTNPHLKNRYAIDFLKLGPDNLFFKKKEESVTDFYSYNESIYSPADATVSQVIDSLESDLMGEPDTVNIGGNFVILNIGNGKYVYFGHFKKASISVKAGDRISAGTFIGSVGNSGNTTLPHLHMHVQNKPISDPENRITFPFRFREIQRMRIAFWRRVENGYLLRNDRVMKTVVE